MVPALVSMPRATLEATSPLRTSFAASQLVGGPLSALDVVAEAAAGVGSINGGSEQVVDRWALGWALARWVCVGVLQGALCSALCSGLCSALCGRPNGGPCGDGAGPPISTVGDGYIIASIFHCVSFSLRVSVTL